MRGPAGFSHASPGRRCCRRSVLPPAACLGATGLTFKPRHDAGLDLPEKSARFHGQHFPIHAVLRWMPRASTHGQLSGEDHRERRAVAPERRGIPGPARVWLLPGSRLHHCPALHPATSRYLPCAHHAGCSTRDCPSTQRATPDSTRAITLSITAGLSGPRSTRSPVKTSCLPCGCAPSSG